MSRLTFIIAALGAFSATAAAPAGQCHYESPTGWAWCQVERSHAAEAQGDLRGAIVRLDEARIYLDDASIGARAIALRERLGRTYQGYTREAVAMCRSARGGVRSEARTACRRAMVRQAYGARVSQR